MDWEEAEEVKVEGQRLSAMIYHIHEVYKRGGSVRVPCLPVQTARGITSATYREHCCVWLLHWEAVIEANLKA